MAGQDRAFEDGGKRPRGRIVHFVCAAGFFGLFVAAILLVLTVFSPEPFVHASVGNHDYSMDEMQEQVDWRKVQALQDDVLSAGSRFMGQPGVYATEAYIRDAFEQAGLEVYEQENWTVAPRTVLREATLPDEGDAPLDGVAVYPFMPNHLQPIATPDEGVTGTLVLLTETALRTRARFDDCIGLIDASEGQTSDECGFDWRRYAQLGLRAVVVSHPGGLEEVPWHRAGGEREGMVGGLPINFPRVAADPGIFDYVGRRIRLRVRVVFEEVENTTLVGILRAGGSSKEKPNRDALIIESSYDACSILPDRAPGVSQALWPATQLALLRGAAPYKDRLVRDVVFVAFGAQMMARDGENNLLRLLDENVLRKERNPFEEAFRFNKKEEASGALTHDASRDTRVQPWRDRRGENRVQLDRVLEVLQVLEGDAGVLVEPEPTRAAMDAMDKETRAFFEGPDRLRARFFCL